jgi:signal transduction histidine kinase
MNDQYTELLKVVVRTDSDVLALRRAGRHVAERLGLDAQDQVRVATALSEVGRSAAATNGGSAVVAVRQDVGHSALVITVSTAFAMRVDGPVADGGVPAARRLLDDVDVHPGPPTEVILTKPLPARVTGGSLLAVRAALDASHRNDAVAEMRAQNAELVRMLDALTESKEALERANTDLARVNAELEETNRGVLAMYRQLSDELEETNSGVVALYAELDERGRQLASANEAKTRFLRNVSHELRTPVNSILGLVSLLGDTPLDDDQRRQVGFLDDSAAALLGLVNELLDLARAESGRQEVELTTVDLVGLVEELRGTTQPLLRPGVRLETPPPHPARIRSDQELLARVLRNLLTNAVKFTEHGRVRLAVAEHDDHVRFTVEDTGLGIPPEHLSSVFEEFVQIPNRLQPSARGTGLGLPYARRTAATLGGSLTVTSAPGEGSAFTLELPLDGPRDAPGAEDPASVAVPADGGTGGDGQLLAGRVVVADDDAAYRAVVVDLLRGSVEHVAEAATVAQAQELVRGPAPDAVVLDVRMPDVDGLAGLARLRAEHPGLPVVLMSSASPPRLPPGAERVVFLPKAELDRTTLRAALRDVLSGGEEPR